MTDRYDRLAQHVDATATLDDDGSPAITLRKHLGSACAIADLAERVMANPSAGLLARRRFRGRVAALWVVALIGERHPRA